MNPKLLYDHPDIDYRWYGRDILWLCSNPNYGESIREIRKKLKIPKKLSNEKLHEILDYFVAQDWLRLKLDDDDGYYWTTNKGIVAYRQIHARQELSCRELSFLV